MKIVIKEEHDDKRDVTVLQGMAWRDEDDGDLDPHARRTIVVSDVLAQNAPGDVILWEKESLMRYLFYDVHKERKMALLGDTSPRG